jgi:surfeit locus 1 family protein
VTSPWRQLLWPAAMTVVMVAVMLGLGTWQWQRLGWKEDILARIDRAEGGPAVPLTAQPAPLSKVLARGTFRHDLVAYYGADIQLTPAGPKMGARLIVPLFRPDGPPVLVDRGWVPLDSERPISQPQGTISVEGYVRPPDFPGWFNPRAIGAALGLPNVASYTLVALGPRPTDMFPTPQQRMPRPPNDHLNYALTWFGLSFILLVIFGIYARRILNS